MTLRLLISKIKGKYLRRFKPLKYAEKIGINFPRGEIHLYGDINWGDRALDYYAW